jgi:hypothetical protein
MGTRRSRIVAVTLLVILGLPLAGKWARRGAAARCELDGVAITPSYRVRALDASGEEHKFCCIRCAALWLRQRPARAVFVTDEATGREINATSAWFVRSQVVTAPQADNYLHAFAHRDDAVKHARTARGTVLAASENPFLNGGPGAGGVHLQGSDTYRP